MNKCARSRVQLMVVLMSVAIAYGQEPLLNGPSGVGGVIRGTENRVATPTQVSADDSKKTEAIPAPQSSLSTSAEQGPAWVIKEVHVIGDLEFVQKENIDLQLRDALINNQPKTEQQIKTSIRSIYDRLIKKGFYLSNLTLPRNPYDTTSQTLTVRVDAGFFGDVKVKFEDGESGTWFSERQIKKYFQSIKPGNVFNYQDLYDKLSDVNAHPDLTLDTKINVRKPIEGEGENRRVVRYADLELVAKEKFPLHAMLDVNNYGTESIGFWQSTLTLQYLNLTRHDDVLTVSPSIALDGSLWSGAASYMLPHDIWKGGATTVYGGWSELEADDVVNNVDLAGMGYFAGLVHSYRLIDTRSRLLSASIGIVYRYIEDQFTALSTKLDQRDITVLPLTLALSYSDRSTDFLWGRNFATLQGVYNLMSGGSSEMEDMWAGAVENYWIARVQYARIQPLFGQLDDRNREIHQWTLFLKAEGQYASDPLIPSEKLFLGGVDTVRGYGCKAFLGDYGLYGTVEFRTPILLDLLAGSFKTRTSTPIDRIQFVTFMDAGHVQSQDPLPGAEDSYTLLSAGGGIRLALTQYSQFRVDYGIPLMSTDDDDDDARSMGGLYVSAQLQF